MIDAMSAKASRIPSARRGESLQWAEQICQSQGVRLTAKRRRLLCLMLPMPGALSAYELADSYRENYGEALPVMTVYRMLDVFTEAGLVHKLRSTNSFVACHLNACNHPHTSSQFLICDHCGQVREMAFADAELNKLQRKARSSGFHLHREQLELHGLCAACHKVSAAEVDRR